MRKTVIFTLCTALAVGFAGCGSKPQVASAPAAAKPEVAKVEPTPAPAELAAQPAAPVIQPTSHSLAAGTLLPVRLSSVIDSSVPNRGFAMGSIETDVKGADGGIAVPAGSEVAIIVRDATKEGPISTLRLGLYSVNVAGVQTPLSNGLKDASTLVLTEDAGKGPSHSAVHLQYGEHVSFKLDAAVKLH